MNTRRICVSIGEKEVEQARIALAAVEGADVAEIRLDYLDSPEPSQFEKPEGVELLFTCRAKWEGGFYDGLEKNRLVLFKKVIDSQAEFLDIEVASEDETKAEIIKYRNTQKSRTKLIFSHHNFTETPALEDLAAIIDVMQDQGADMGKLITTAQDSRDVLRIFTAIEYARSIDFPLIAFGMGEKGAVSRVATCDMGGYMTYCSADGLKATARGQIAVSTMQNIHNLYP